MSPIDFIDPQHHFSEEERQRLDRIDAELEHGIRELHCSQSARLLRYLAPRVHRCSHGSMLALMHLAKRWQSGVSV